MILFIWVNEERSNCKANEDQGSNESNHSDRDLLGNEGSTDNWRKQEWDGCQGRIQVLSRKDSRIVKLTSQASTDDVSQDSSNTDTTHIIDASHYYGGQLGPDTDTELHYPHHVKELYISMFEKKSPH